MSAGLNEFYHVISYFAIFNLTREGAVVPRSVMTKKLKVTLVILIPLFIFVITLYLILCSLYIPEPEPLVYPAGDLSASLFVSQNNEYTENDSLTESHSFSSIPFVIDVPPAQGAKVGSGTIYQAEKDYYIYLAEYTDKEDVQEIISKQFPKAVMIDYIDTLSSYNCMVSEFGYINGFSANYIVDQLYVSNGKEKAMSCIVGYALDCPDEYEGQKLFVAVGTSLQTSEAFASCKKMLDLEMQTLRYDTALEYELERLERQKLMEEAEAAKEEKEAEETFSDKTVIDEEKRKEPESNVTQFPVRLSDPSPVVNITVTWSNPADQVVLELFIPDGSAYCEPVSQDGNSAVFTLKDAAPGTYMLHVKNYLDCGTINIDLDGLTPSGGDSLGSPGSGESGEEAFDDFETFE